MKNMKKSILTLKTLFYSLSIIVVLIVGFIGVTQTQNVRTLIPHSQTISTGILNLPINSTFPFSLDIDQAFPNQYISYNGYLKVLAKIQFRLQKDYPLSPGYELELSFTNQLSNPKSNNNSTSNLDPLGTLGCPTRVIHILITQEGRVVGIPFYGLQCSNLNNSIPIFNYNFFVFNTDTPIPQNQTSPSYFDLLANFSTRHYWDDWENIFLNNTSLTIWDLKNSLFLWDSTQGSLTQINKSFLGSSFSEESQSLKGQDPWSPILSNFPVNEPSTIFTTYFIILAKNLFTIWNSTFFYFPFFQASLTDRTYNFHCGLASTTVFQNFNSNLVLNFPNISLPLNNVIFVKQFEINTQYSWTTGYPQILSESSYSNSILSYTADYYFS